MTLGDLYRKKLALTETFLQMAKAAKNWYGGLTEMHAQRRSRLKGEPLFGKLYPRETRDTLLVVTGASRPDVRAKRNGAAVQTETG